MRRCGVLLHLGKDRVRFGHDRSGSAVAFREIGGESDSDTIVHRKAAWTARDWRHVVGLRQRLSTVLKLFSKNKLTTDSSDVS